MSKRTRDICSLIALTVIVVALASCSEAPETPNAVQDQSPTPTVQSTAIPTAPPAPSAVPDSNFDPAQTQAPLSVVFSAEDVADTDSFEWSFGDGSSSADPNPTHVYEIAGTYPVTLTLSGPGGTTTTSLDHEIAVTAGTANSIVLEPESVEGTVDETVVLSATAFDRFGNELEDPKFQWSAVDDAVTIDSTGSIRLGTESGEFPQAVTLALETLEESIDVSILPGPPSAIQFNLNNIDLEVGERVQIEAQVTDRFGNRVASPGLRWSSNQDAGAINAIGLFRGGTTAGTYPAAVAVMVSGTDVTRTVDVTLRPGPPAAVQVSPSLVVATSATDYSFSGLVVDSHGNEAGDLELLWSTEVGTVDQSGRLTLPAGEPAGSHKITARAQSPQGIVSGNATVAIGPTWIDVPDTMPDPRAGHTATTLGDGTIFIQGGALNQIAEVFDPSSMTFRTVGESFCHHAGGSTATLLPDGRVLIVGGNGSAHRRCVEIYDPDTERFRRAADMTVSRSGHTATLLGDGRVLIAGGSEWLDPDMVHHASTEIYDPETETFSIAGAMTTKRHDHVATKLDDGTVVIIGGYSYSTAIEVEIFNPFTESFSTAGFLPARHHGESHRPGVLLPGGQIVLVGPGVLTTFDSETGASGSIEPTRVFDFALQEYVMHRVPRWAGTATLLADGTVLFVGGEDNGETVSAVMRFGPATGVIAPEPSMSIRRQGHTANTLNNGLVVVIGGSVVTGGEVTLEMHRSAEIYVPRRER